MNLKDKMQELKERSYRLAGEQQELRALLDKKSGELKGLAEGVQKYQDNSKLSENMNQILRQKVAELKLLKTRIDDHKKEIKANKLEMQKFFALANKQRRQKQAQKAVSLNVSGSEAVEQAIHMAIEHKPQDIKEIKAEEIATPKAEPKEEHKAPAVHKKTAKPKKDLYSQAADEAKAQEDFLKKQSTRSYGNA